MANYFENKFVIYTFVRKDVLFMKFKKGVYIDAVVAKEILFDRFQLQQDKSVYVICDIDEIVGISLEARCLLQSIGPNLVVFVVYICSQILPLSILNYFTNQPLNKLLHYIVSSFDEAMQIINKY
ncbi:hypothetical protein [Flavobacterium sp. JP2137]|uniref:DUF7793 family protein n=1 Tax=Flavobacterium sp. JP2137 TaxID=3414510 RepID=UPI003D2FAA11